MPNLVTLRRQIAAALARDDELMELLVLKGGNALELVHDITMRASIDLDYSVEADIDDVEAMRARIQAALANRLDTVGYHVFDVKLSARPREGTTRLPARWGGYRIEFKIIQQTVAHRVGYDLEAMRRQAELSGPEQKRTYRIEISKHEYCEPAVVAEVEGHRLRVYSLSMIVAEKLRAICASRCRSTSSVVIPRRGHETSSTSIAFSLAGSSRQRAPTSPTCWERCSRRRKWSSSYFRTSPRSGASMPRHGTQ